MNAKAKYIILGVVVFFVFSCSTPSYLPDELTGVWITSNPRYADRFFELSKVSAIFGTGGATLDTYFISNVEKKLKGNRDLYIIYCHREGEDEQVISFYYTSENGGLILFKNQTHIEWFRGDAVS